MADIAGSVVAWPASRMKDYAWLDELLLAQPGTERDFNPAWQANKYLLGTKMYAYIGIQDQVNRPILTLKLEPLYSDMLRKEYTAIVPGYYMNKTHWSTVYLDEDVPREVIADMVCASHRVLLSSLSKKAQKEILDKASDT